MNINESLTLTVKKFEAAGILSAQLDAEVLLAHLLRCTRADLMLQRNTDLTKDQIRTFESFLKRRQAREPIAYITGTKEFWSLPLHVTPDVLIPRPETEHLVEAALEIMPQLVRRSLGEGGSPLHILEIGTGSGCITMALAHELLNAQFTVIDISERALALAKENLQFAQDRVTFLNTNLFEELSSTSKFDLILSNPPYLSASDMEACEPELLFEPREALYGGKDGLEIIRQILLSAPSHLTSHGWVLLEIGATQADAVKTIASTPIDNYDYITTKRDLAQKERVIGFRKKH
ncbi:MAG: protein-(glutamine-N5) methyltransferase, release factor-specific [Deltaproteobacteria bacterium RIFCSPLOWO2_02_FULL_44_10]|nr:MAG: protein-(glutamine-N5) methyltransferase, release factor-specific [Deltaproteobacteria bacterium RIFCSPHIGHO2_02_FULL_44_16]OGQ46443.1 MAG: protein-(glutamine-N5) methyltransferase, release factor-specific [Deltaproteobacteria bacterium RIFCSPLOWO2_02_FULL_44_10]